MNNHIEAWMFRAPYETLSLVITVVVLVSVGVIFSMLNVWIVFGLLVFYLIYVKIQQNGYLGNSIRVHTQQYPEIYETFKNHAQQLQIKKANIYISQNPFLNASTIGISTCTVVLNSSIIEQMTHKEVSFIIGHELGHFKAGHTKVSTFLIPLGNSSIISNILFGFWSRKAELTSDRCGLALTKDLESGMSTLIKLSLGSKLYKEFNVEGYLRQFKKADSTGVKLSEILSLADHPYLANRLKNLIQYWKVNFTKK